MKQFIAIVAVLFTLIGCSRSREVVHVEREGDIYALISVQEQADVIVRATQARSVYLEIRNSSGVLVKDSTLDITGSVLTCHVEGIREGTNYQLILWSENGSGDTIHSPKIYPFSITADELTELNCSLLSRCGSIIFQIAETPTAVESLSLVFDSDSGYFAISEDRESKQSLELDNIPYDASGGITLTMYGESSIISSWDTVFTFANNNSSSTFSLVNNGGLGLSVSLEEPATAVFTGFGDTTQALQSESGDLIITEFCATGGSNSSSREYIELFNPGSSTFSADSLLITISGDEVWLTEVSISSGGYFVVATDSGNCWNPDVTADVDMSSTSGTIVISSDNVVHDYLFYFNDSDAGWEKLSSSSKCAWVLDESERTASMNNIGSNWSAAVTEMAASDGLIWYGTPGEGGN